MLKQRVITAVILALVVVGCLIQENSLWTRALFTLMLLAATAELIMLTLRLPGTFSTALALPFAALFWWSGAYMGSALILWQTFSATVLWILIAIGLCFYRHNGHWPPVVRVLLLVISLDLLWICAHGLMYVHLEQGGLMLFYLFSLVWIADIGAYFSGRRFGRNKLAPAISPGKTREGVVGGLLANVVWIFIVFQFTGGWGIDFWPFLLMSIAAALISVVGDLYVSVLKREAGVKDSSRLLPGHGGVLDRIDSINSATPVFVSGLFVAGQL